MIRIPEPTLKVTENHTPFPHLQCQKMGKGRVFHDVVVFKGTFELGPGKIQPSEHQAPVVLSDQYHDAEDASRSSLALPGDLIVAKPTTDVIVTGTARTPNGKAMARWDCSVIVQRKGAALLESSLVVTGPRRFVHRALRGWRLSEPEPAVEVPIRYELAYGGSYENPAPNDDLPFIVEKTNPCGRGFFGDLKLDASRAYDGPQWETRAAPVTTINVASPLAGFGPVARMWRARFAFGGTYDDSWERRLRRDVAEGLPPDYPPDFDPRFFQCAHPSLIAPTRLRGGDTVRLIGLTDGGEISFELPQREPLAEVLLPSDEWCPEPLSLDLVHVDLDTRRVFLTWRTSLASHREIIAVFASVKEH